MAFRQKQQLSPEKKVRHKSGVHNKNDDHVSFTKG